MKTLAPLLIGLAAFVPSATAQETAPRTFPNIGDVVRGTDAPPPFDEAKGLPPQTENPDIVAMSPEMAAILADRPIREYVIVLSDGRAEVQSTDDFRGAPGQTYNLHKGVMISAIDLYGRTIHRTAVGNPRLVRTEDDGVDIIELATGQFVVRLPEPDLIQGLMIEVTHGPGAGDVHTIALTQGTPTLRLDPSELQRLRRLQPVGPAIERRGQ